MSMACTANPSLPVGKLEELAREIRGECLTLAHQSGEGHLSSSLCQIELLTALYFAFMNLSGTQEQRDRFILSKGHGCLSWYVALAKHGDIPAEWLSSYAREGSPLPNHPCKHSLPVSITSAGSLGQGLGIATGILYGLRLKRELEPRCVVLMGDGECNEGSVWESAMFAAAQKLDNLLAIVDNNGIQAVGKSDEIMGHTDLSEKFRAFGWDAVTIDGNSIPQILETLTRFPFTKGKPSAIIARTRTMVPFMDGKVLWHYRVPSAEELETALQDLQPSLP
ncbi:MAG: transketolase [Geobacter sp.]|nr:transketolase [Geobacter sp.]